MTIVEFIEARLAEDEAIASANESTQWPDISGDDDFGYQHWRDEHGDVLVYSDSLREDMVPHIARHDPARVLAQVAAIRAIVDRYQKALKRDRDNEGDLAAAGRTLALHGVMKDLAAIWSDHQAYDPAWSPSAAARPQPPATHS